tara:strand:+ start:667 stop:1755 length:1089 start_codon:yes stop_codon:yes gene_type:complete
MTVSKEKVAVGMSGGVDSSIAAYLLSESGYEVKGIFMKNWEEDDGENCSSKEDYEDAMRVCKYLGIELNLVNFSDKYWTDVFESFITELKKGRTPNPDVFCNKEIKFKQYYQYAMSLNFDLIATGHYACKTNTKVPELHIPKDKVKDQTYFLYMINQTVLKNTLFPLQDLNKDEVKTIADDLKLDLSHKKESMGICFIGKRKFSTFIDKYIPPVEGEIINFNTGEQIGHHAGISKYTIGQRKGIKLGGMKNSLDSPWYVIDKDIGKNKLYVSQNQSPLIYSGIVELVDFSFINKDFDNKNIKVRFRHGGKLRDCDFKTINDRYIIDLKDSERGIAPGQAAVLYQGSQCLGGGVVKTKCLNKN